jgi:fibronectin-binding autotransporter adhesin
VTKIGTGTLVLTGANTYSGGTAVSAGNINVDNAGGSVYSAPTSQPRTITATNTTTSGTGTGAVTVQSGATLAGSGTIASTTGGVVLNAGSTLVSGDAQPASTVTGTGLTLNNAANLTSVLAVNSANLTFALGADNGGNVGGAFSFASPNTNSTYLSVAGNVTGEINFTGSLTVTIQDLTNGALALSLNTPYLLIQAGSDTDYSGLVTESGGVLAQNGNGYVVGVGTLAGYVPITITQLGPDGLGLANPYYDTNLYLFNGDLEIVPEPGAWAMMLGGLALLLFCQRQRGSRRCDEMPNGARGLKIGR